ncbi:hypothetical protein OC861_006791, partial [Tilletia horrida]
TESVPRASLASDRRLDLGRTGTTGRKGALYPLPTRRRTNVGQGDQGRGPRDNLVGVYPRSDKRDYYSGRTPKPPARPL